MANKYKTIGSVRKGDYGNYIKITEDVVLKKGTVINLQDPRKLPDQLLAAGKITEEIAEKMRERAKDVPEFVKFELRVKEGQ